MIKTILLLGISMLPRLLPAQERPQTRDDYLQRKEKIITQLKSVAPGKFGEFVPGIKTIIVTQKKILALTFDACGGPTGSGYDTMLIEYLKREKIQATLFVSGSWIEKNDSLFRQLCREPLFEIENHGLAHQPCSITAKSKYGIKGTGSLSKAYDEIAMNADRIALYTEKKPQFYRPAAAVADEGCVTIANALDEKVITFDVLAGDAARGAPVELIRRNVLAKARPGSIIIMHMNHPERNGFEALAKAVPDLRSLGFEFVRLDGNSLKGKN